ncbi:MAG: phosphoribosylformylglycinamidine synthase subunit PurQ [Bdellovibrionales bacterium]|nr:phosphoribosylformylglycinamidine synthase subunit PurQ [Bdellovibrionales bacterium]
MRSAVVTFPGTNCEHDIEVLVQSVTGALPQKVWAKDRTLPDDTEVLFVPGGFSYGDYLRCGAMAKVSPVAAAIREFAASGKPVVGICNGFQILCELGLLPGVLLPNRTTKFLSRMVSMKVESTNTPITARLDKGEVFTVPIAHFDGNYFATADEVKRLEDNDQVVFRYCGLNGEVDHESPLLNPNGSVNSIAGVRNEAGNVVGYMPHPERIIEADIDPNGTRSALRLFEAIL